MFCVNCKKYKFPTFLLCKNLYCANHARLHYNSIIVIIQKIYRGYKVRKILKNIYFKLPRDLQVHILSFNSIKINKAREKDYLKPKNIIKEATIKISDFHNLSATKITLTEINDMLTTLIKYKTYIDIKWFNYYKYYFNNIYSILLLLSEVYDLPYTFAYLVSIINNNIYESLDLTYNLSNNNFKATAKIILANITLFLANSKRSIK
jgi:hypothetical protein